MTGFEAGAINMPPTGQEEKPEGLASLASGAVTDLPSKVNLRALGRS
jgi:hypothetical protein